MSRGCYEETARVGFQLKRVLVVEYDVGSPDVFRRHVKRVDPTVISGFPHQTAVGPLLYTHNTPISIVR